MRSILIIVAAFIGVLLPLSCVLAADGDLDTTFGIAGVQQTVEPGFGAIGTPMDIAVQSDDKIVVVTPRNGNFSVFRYNTDGTPDTAFGVQGEATTDFPALAEPTAIAIQQDGKIVVAGIPNSVGPFWGVARFHGSDGLPDTSFGTNGLSSVRTADIDGGAFGAKTLALNNGKIIIGGFGSLCGAFSTLARLDASGSMDSSFGPTDPAIPGVVTFTPIPPACSANVSFGFASNSLGLQSDGKIVIAGIEHDGNGNNSLLLARFIN